MRDQKSVSHDATLTLHAGAGHREIGAPVSSPPVLATSFFTHPDAVGFSANDLNEAAPHFYTRWSNPTLELLETRLAVRSEEVVHPV
jgi:cystathionine gamma-synthase/methionine-gamma-lyase